MLKQLVRFSAFACVVFLAILSAVYVSAEERDGLPDADFSVSLDFEQSSQTRDEIIDGLDEYASQHPVRVVRVRANSGSSAARASRP